MKDRDHNNLKQGPHEMDKSWEDSIEKKNPGLPGATQEEWLSQCSHLLWSPRPS